MEILRGKIVTAQKVAVYGPEGIGKSTFAAQFPDPVFIDTEGGTKHMDVARFPKPASWAMLLGEAQEAKTTPGLKTLVLDTADWAEQLCTQHICAKANVTGVESFGYGKGYTYVMEEFGRLLNCLEEVVEQGIHVVVTAHAKMRKFEQPDEMGAYDRWELKMSDKTRSLLKEWADMVLFANYKTFAVKTDSNKMKAQGGERVMYTTHHPCWDAKNRCGLKPELPFSFAEIAHCFTDATPPRHTPDTLQPHPVPERRPRSAATNLQKEPEPAPVPAVNAPPEIPAGIPKALADLMTANRVTLDEIRQAVAFKGYFPADTPIEKYGSQFIDGVLIGAWDKVFKVIQEDMRDLPFE